MEIQQCITFVHERVSPRCTATLLYIDGRGWVKKREKNVNIFFRKHPITDRKYIFYLYSLDFGEIFTFWVFSSRPVFPYTTDPPTQSFSFATVTGFYPRETTADIVAFECIAKLSCPIVLGGGQRLEKWQNAQLDYVIHL